MTEDMMDFGEYHTEVIYTKEDKAYEELALLGIDAIAHATFKDHYILKRTGDEYRHFNVVFVLEGVLSLQMDKRHFTLHPGDCAFIPSWVSRDIELIEGQLYREVYFRLRLSNDNKIKSLDGLVFPSPYGEKMAQAIQNIVDERESELAKAKRIIQSSSSLIASYFYRECCKIESSFVENTAEKLRAFWKEIEEELANDWCIDSLATEYGASKSSFYRLIKKHYQKTPLNYLRSLRMEKAKELLSQTSWSLDRIAEQLSYSSAYAFSQTFYKYTGQRPGQFRKEN